MEFINITSMWKNFPSWFWQYFPLVENCKTIELVFRGTHPCLKKFPPWFNNIHHCEKEKWQKMGLRRNTFTVDKTSHHGLIAFTNVKTQITQDGFTKKQIHGWQNFPSWFNSIYQCENSNGTGWVYEETHTCGTNFPSGMTFADSRL